MSKFYAVKIGRKPGIYFTWPECQTQVSGFSGAIYKSFNSINEAKLFVYGSTSNDINGSTSNDTNGSTSNDTKKSTSDLIAYVDGSYNSDNNVVGYGIYIIDGNQTYSYIGNFVQQYEGRNVEGEVKASLIAAQFAYKYKKSITIYHDYIGISNWANNLWKRNKPYTQDYYSKIQSMRNTININFIHVKSHTGIDGNEYADRLAKYASNLPYIAREPQQIDIL